MKKFIYQIFGILLLFPVYISNTFGISINDFKDEVFRPENLIAGTSEDISADGKIIQIIKSIIQLILYASGSVTVFMIVLGGFFIVTAINSDDREKGKKIIQYAITGLLVVILSYALVTNVLKLVYKAAA